MRKYLSANTLGKELTLDLLKRKVYSALSQDYDGIAEPDYLEGHLIEHNPYLNKDIFGKVKFDFENFTYESEEWNKSNNLIGQLCIGDFIFWGMYAGGDWESPIYFLLYLDHENRLRGFVPDNGQAWRRDTKQAFGNDYEGDENYCVKHFNDVEPPDFKNKVILDCIKARFGLKQEWQSRYIK